MKPQDYINLEDELGAHNYKPLDVVLTAVKASGYGMWRATSIWTVCRLIRR